MLYCQPNATLYCLTEYTARQCAVSTMRLLMLEGLDEDYTTDADNNTDHVREYALALTFYRLMDLSSRLYSGGRRARDDGNVAHRHATLLGWQPLQVPEQ